MIKTVIIKPEDGNYAVVLLSLDKDSLEVIGSEIILLTKKYPEAILEARKQKALLGVDI